MALTPHVVDVAVLDALIPRIAESQEMFRPVFYQASEGYTTGVTPVADGGLRAKR